MRIRVDLQLDKPLRRGGRIAIVDDKKFWVSLKYERLLVSFFCVVGWGTMINIAKSARTTKMPQGNMVTGFVRMETQRLWVINPDLLVVMVAEKDDLRMEWMAILIPQQKYHPPQ